MNIIQFLLLKLAEEGKEVGQMCDKSMQFGLLERNPELLQNNKERLIDEINDFYAQVEMLNEYANLGFKPDPEKIAAKKRKVVNFLRYSESLGNVNLSLSPQLRELNGINDLNFYAKLNIKPK